MVKSKTRGFGTTLIEQAIPHEMDGVSELEFRATGVTARLALPVGLLDFSGAATSKPSADPTVLGVPEALRNGLLKVQLPALALLDVNLGRGETTEALAMELMRRKVPFLFVTGYGEGLALRPELSHAPVPTKPVKQARLAAAMPQLI